MSLFLGPHEFVSPNLNRKECIIKSVTAYVLNDKDLEEDIQGGADCHSQKSGHWIVDTPISTPMSIYEIYKHNRKLWGIDAIGSMIVKVELYNGIIGVGVSIGGEPGCFIVEKHLYRFLEGQSIFNIELMWEQMYRSTLNYGRKGLVIQAISACDLALWDALGKYKKEPVYNLLGGKCKDKLPVYATTVRPDLAQQLGFHGAKIPLPYSHSDGNKGLIANINRIKECCKSIKKIKDNKYPIMIDCYMSLTLPYTIELLNNIQSEIIDNKKEFGHINIKWIEEYLPPDNYNDYKYLYNYVKSNNKLSSILLTTGEHEYTKYGFKQLLDNKCCDIIQPDITWLGGITEAKKVVSLAASYNINVIPHGSSVYSYHLQYSNTNCPIAEYIILSPNANKIVPLFGNLFIDEPLPKNGYITLDENKYGFGVTLNPNLQLKRPYKHQIKTLNQILNDKNNRKINYQNWLNKHSKGSAKVGPLGNPLSKL